MQRARCYLIGETAVVLELEPPVTLASQKRIWRLAQRLVDMPNVVEAIPGMNDITVILRNPESLALDAIERLQRWWEGKALEPESRFIEIPVVYGGAGGPDLAVVAAHCGLSEKQVVELHSSVEYVGVVLVFNRACRYSGVCRNNYTRHGALNRACSFRQVLSGMGGPHWCLSAGNAGWLAVDWSYLTQPV